MMLRQNLPISLRIVEHALIVLTIEFEIMFESHVTILQELIILHTKMQKDVTKLTYFI